MAKLLSFFKHIPRPYGLALLSGFMVGTTYIPFPAWALFFCYIPLWIAVVERYEAKYEVKKIFIAGWIAQFVLTLIGFNWIYYLAREFGELPWFLSLASLLLFAAGMHLYIPLSLVISTQLFKKMQIQAKWVQFVILALTLSFLERMWPSIFEWNIGYTLLWMKIPLFQWADVVGFWGLSTWILLIQALIAYAWTKRKEDQTHALIIFSGTALTVVLLTLGGLWKEKSWSATDSQIKIGVIQGNVGNADKVRSEKKDQFQSHILNIFTELTDEHLKKSPETEFVIWPETALPFALDKEYHTRLLQGLLLSKTQLWNTTVVTGAYSQSQTKRDHLGYPLTSNSVFFVGPVGGLVAQTYNKTDLLVFGEYMPLGEQLPFLYKLLPFVGVYERGPGPFPQQITLKNGNTVMLGPQICYESLDVGFSRNLAKKGSQIIFNVTNDSWFGWWAEPYQHNIMTLARAIEVRRPMVRATNTGISSAILANGKRLEDSPIGKTWAHTYDIRYLKNPSQSFYTLYGHWDWVLWLILFLYLAFKGKYVRD